MALSDKQKDFCKLYVQYNNGSKAAIEVGYKGNAAATQLLKREDIQHYIAELRETAATEEPQQQIELPMDTAAEIKQTIRLIAEMVINGQLDSRRASTLNALCNTALSSIRTDEQQKEIEELRETITELMEGDNNE